MAGERERVFEELVQPGVSKKCPTGGSWQSRGNPFGGDVTAIAAFKTGLGGAIVAKKHQFLRLCAMSADM